MHSIYFIGLAAKEFMNYLSLITYNKPNSVAMVLTDISQLSTIDEQRVYLAISINDNRR